MGCVCRMRHMCCMFAAKCALEVQHGGEGGWLEVHRVS
jgi:hypothetical protein